MAKKPLPANTNALADEYGPHEAKKRFEAALRGSRVAKPKSYEESKVGKQKRAAKGLGLNLDNMEERTADLRKSARAKKNKL